MRRILPLLASTTVVVVVGGWAAAALGPDSARFGVVAAWLPMTAFGTASHLAGFALPDVVHRLRTGELDGRRYERLGIRVVKRLLRRGPATAFNPGLRMPAVRSPEQLAALAARMRTAEASHLVSFAVTALVALHAVSRGWWASAATAAGLDVVLNAYPAMLQRYNRAWLLRAAPGADSRRRR